MARRGVYEPHLEIYADDVKCSHGATVGQLEEGNIELQEDECIAMSESTFRDIIVGSRRKWKDAWSKEYGEMDEDRLVETILKYMEDWMMADRRENQIVILPAVGRLAGQYPADYKGGGEE